MGFLDDVCRENDCDVGRVAMAIGTYKGTPIAVFEHQMGCGACEIICRELFAPGVSRRKYVTDKFIFNSAKKFAIRVGSCGGINTETTSEEEKVNVYDVIVSRKSVGISGATMQSETGRL